MAYGNEREVFDRYAAQPGDRLGRRSTRDLRVWCPWYSFYRTITEPALHAVVNELDRLAFEIVQVDDGCQRGVGDWQPNGGFPSGMAALADQIPRPV